MWKTPGTVPEGRDSGSRVFRPEPNRTGTPESPNRVPAPISIIVPVFNEAATIAAVIARLLEIDLPAPREIIVVNDGSSDGTRAVLDGLAAAHRDLIVVHAERNRGKGHALRARVRARARHASSRSRTPTSSSIRRSSPCWSMPILHGDDGGRLRIAVPRRTAGRAVAHDRRQPGADLADQRALRRRR